MYMYKRQIGYQKGTFNTGCIFSFTLLKRKTTAFYFKIKWYEIWVSSDEHKWHFLTSWKTSYSKESISSCLLYNFITVFLWDSFFSIILGAHLMMPWRYSSKWPKGQIKCYKQRKLSDHIINSFTCIQKFRSESKKLCKSVWKRLNTNNITKCYKFTYYNN